MPTPKRSFEPILLSEESVTEKRDLQTNANLSGERQENGRRKVIPITGILNSPRRNQANNDEGNTK